MLIISKGQVNNLIRRLEDGSDMEACIDEVRNMVEIKSAFIGRCDDGIGCGAGGASALRGTAMSLGWEVDLLETALAALEKGDITGGIELLQKYAGAVGLTR